MSPLGPAKPRGERWLIGVLAPALPPGNPSYTEVLAAHARVVALTARVVGTGARDGVLGEYGLLLEERGEAEAAFRRLLRAVAP